MTDRGFNLIFVAGAMRSGTTLLQQVLCSSPAANPFVHGCRYLTSQIMVYAQYAGTDRLYVPDYLGDAQGLFDFTKDILDRLLDQTHERLGRPQCLVLKNPELSRFIPQAALLIPDARFVVSVRDPKDTIASMIRVGEKHREDKVKSFLAGAGRDIRALCASYRQFYIPLLNAIRGDHAGLRERTLFIGYESLIGDTEAAIAHLSDFSQLPLEMPPSEGEANWRSRIDEDELAGEPHWSAYVTELSGGPISAASIGRFREVLSAAEIEEIDRRCADLSRAFGYRES